jgi:hypothetical protein
MKKLITYLLLIITFSVFTIPVFAKTPNFQLHIIKNLAPGVNYSINDPIAFDYDGDGDLDILILTKEGTLYFLENITND